MAVIVALVLGLAAGAVAATAAVPRDDEVTGAADAVVVLGGAPERVELGLALAEAYGGELVLSSGAIELGEARGLACGRDMRCLHPEPVTTAGEAAGTRALADEHGWERVLVATSRYHANRARLLFGQCLDDVAVVGAPPPGGGGPTLRQQANELLGMVAGATIRRAC